MFSKGFFLRVVKRWDYMCCRVLGRLGRILSLNVYVWVLAFGGSKEVKKTLSLSVHHLIISPGVCLGDLLTD